MTDEEEMAQSGPLDIIKSYITKDPRERSEMNQRVIFALSQLRSIALELGWEWTLGVIDEYLHMMRSTRRQGIKEDIQLLSGMLMPLGNPLPEPRVNTEGPNE
jgi:hypothetical protein